MRTHRHSGLFWQLPACLRGTELVLTPLPQVPSSQCLPQPCAHSPARLLWAELGLPSQLPGARMMSLVPLAWLSLGDS